MKTWRNWTLVWLGWTLVGLAFAGQHYLTSIKVGAFVPWKVAVAGALADWYVFALLSLPTLRLATQFRLAGRHWKLRLVFHLVAGAVFSLLWILLRTGLAQLLVPLRGVEQPFNEVLRYVLAATFFFNMLVYWVVVTGAHARAYYQSFLERERRVLELEARLTSAQLQALQMQLNPHFLFNALNGISTLMYRDVDAADSMLIQLANLLRGTLEMGRRQTVPLKEELDFIHHYLALEQMRFGDRLQIQKEVDPTALACPVPGLVLQPLIENSLKHGLARQPGLCILQIRVRWGSPEELVLEVQDNGIGLDTTGPHSSGGKPALEGEQTTETFGIGLTNTRARLQQLYGTRASLTLTAVPEGGVLARITIPVKSSRP